MALSPVRAVLLASNDDVAAALDAVTAGGTVKVTLGATGEAVRELAARQDIPFGYKLALHDIAMRNPVHRYGFPIGIATRKGDPLGAAR